MKNIELTLQLWNKLWQNYSQRVNYAQIYQQMINHAGGTVTNDHIAFRSLRLNVDGQNLGIEYLAQIVEALGYEAAGEYTFPDQKLYARHYRHPQQAQFDLPKLFISELIVDQLPDAIATLIYQTVTSNLDVTSNNLYTQLTQFLGETNSKLDIESFTQELKAIFSRPWDIPLKSDVEKVNAVSQYGAWVLIHGYAVNHFTGYINRQNTPIYHDIDSTAQGLTNLGVPMKTQIEGSREIGLRQTATQAVIENIAVRDDSNNELISIPWTYAYYELAERNLIQLESGKEVLFDAFIGANAQHLFEMTRKS